MNYNNILERLLRFLVTLLLILNTVSVNSQTIMNLPAPYYYPIDHSSEDEKDKFIFKQWPQKKPEYWLVMSDRDNNNLYNKPEGNEVTATLKFKEYGYVIEDAGTWVKIGIGRREDNKFRELRKSGWIHKKNLLLWPKSLVDENNSISKKAFLLNKVSELDRVIREPNYKLVRVYDGPESPNVIVDKNIYEVYFIYKREGTRILLGGNNSINHTNLSEYIIGWVDEYRIQKWNQRLALECNYDQDFFTERKNNPEKQVVGFVDSKDAVSFAVSGVKENVLWDSDPVKLEPALLAKSDRKRPIGEVFRFPVFTSGENYIESGVLAKIPTKSGNKITGEFGVVPQIKMEEVIRYMKQKKSRVNIYFLIEGTETMQPFRASIVSAISNLETKLPDDVEVKFGAAVYRDVLLKDQNLDFALKKLNTDKESIINFINDQSFVSYAEDSDTWTNFRSALRQVLVKGEIPKNELNMVIVMGANADFAFSKSRLLGSNPDECIVDEKLENVEQKLDDLGISLSFFQIKNEDSRSFTRFAEDARSMIVNVAQKQEARQDEILKGQKTTQLNIPDFLDSESELQVNGVAFGYIKRPVVGGALKQNEILEGIKTSINTVVSRFDKAYQVVFDMVASGENADNISDEFAPIIWDVLSKQVKSKGMNLESIDKLKDDKVKLYSKLFLPGKIPGVEQPYKTVVFMPASELNDYIEQLGQMERAMNGPSDQQREEIYNVVVDLMQKLSGDRMKLYEINESSVDDLRKKMNGLEIEGFNMKTELGFRIEDIKNKKVFDEKMLEDFGARIVSRRKELKKIRDLGPNYDFSYTILDNGNLSLYYWISTDKLF
jgi:hypothetical protein